MKSSKLNNSIVSVESAWLCAAETDVAREEQQRVEILTRRRRQHTQDKYELDSEATRLDQELKEQRLEWQKKTELRRQRQLPRAERELVQAAEQNGSNNRKKGSIYAMENRRLSMLLGDVTLRQRVKRKKRRPRVVNDMLSLERRYAASARRIQRWWRGYLHREFWRLYFRQVKAVVQLQRLARGFLTRRWIRIWHANRTLRVTRVQALFRGYYIRRCVLVTRRRWEYLNAAKIQSIVRMYFAKQWCAQLQEEIAVLHIQSLWRGFSSRKESDMLWLSAKATNLQRLIQRMFRGMKTRMEIEELLRERETRNRQELMAMMEAEEEWYRGQRDKLQARLNRLQLLQQVCQLEEEYFRKHEHIYDMESIYLDMQTQRMRVSPRAIEQGWVEEMEEKMKKQRALITKLKMETVFDLGLRFKTKEDELRQFQWRIRQLEEKRRWFEIWRDEEFLDYWERECQFRHEVKLVQRRQHIAETRRRWAIQFYRLNGKRDHRWRGTCWTPQVLEEAKERETFCLGNTDILALIRDKWEQRKRDSAFSQRVRNDEDEKRETREHIDVLADQIALVEATSEIEQTKALFDPVFQDVERSFHEVQRRQRSHEKHLAGVRIERQRQQNIPVELEEADVAVAREEEDPARLMDRFQKKRQLMLAAKVPWHLLDQLAAERHSLAQEKAMFKLWGKSSVGD